MIVPDINLLVYAHNEAAPQHPIARQWWEELLTQDSSVGIPWAVVWGFVRLVTHTAVLTAPLRPAEALARVDSWFSRGNVCALDPGPRHLAIVGELFRETGVAGVLTTDTHIAAIAIEHQAELHSIDSDFSRFSGLRWKNPLRQAR